MKGGTMARIASGAALALVLFLVGCCNPGNIGSVPVTLNGQQTNMWCWAASGQMTMNYVHPASNVQQCDEAVCFLMALEWRRRAYDGRDRIRHDRWDKLCKREQPVATHRRSAGGVHLRQVRGRRQLRSHPLERLLQHHLHGRTMICAPY